jgi:serine/threonine-protein kinase RsbW
MRTPTGMTITELDRQVSLTCGPLGVAPPVRVGTESTDPSAVERPLAAPEGKAASNLRPLVRLEFASALEMLELVQLVSDHVSGEVGFDEDGRYWVSAAVREAAFNAIEHGNHRDKTKHIFIEFGTGQPQDESGPIRFCVRVRDEGSGFDPRTVPDPSAPENLLKPSGRGLLLIRRAMDDVQIERAPEGGTEICMSKRIDSVTRSSFRTSPG